MKGKAICFYKATSYKMNNSLCNYYNNPIKRSKIGHQYYVDMCQNLIAQQKMDPKNVKFEEHIINLDYLNSQLQQELWQILELVMWKNVDNSQICIDPYLDFVFFQYLGLYESSKGDFDQ